MTEEHDDLEPEELPTNDEVVMRDQLLCLEKSVADASINAYMLLLEHDYTEKDVERALDDIQALLGEVQKRVQSLHSWLFPFNESRVILHWGLSGSGKSQASKARARLLKLPINTDGTKMFELEAVHALEIQDIGEAEEYALSFRQGGQGILIIEMESHRAPECSSAFDEVLSFPVKARN